jgi:hypothetical protein
MTLATRAAPAVLTALVATSLAARPVRADRTALVVGGELDTGESGAVRAAALGAVEAVGWSVVGSEPDAAAAAKLFQCLRGDEAVEERCLAGVVDGTEAERAIVLHVSSQQYGQSTYRVVSGWVLRRSGKRLVFERIFCPACRRDGLARSARALVDTLLRKARSRATPSLLAVRSTPAGARITLDGKVVGATDAAGAEFRVSPGRHLVRLERSGFAAATREVVIDDGEHAAVEVTLEPAPGPSSPIQTGTRAHRSRLLPWLLVGTGAAALAGGGLLLALDEDAGLDGEARGPHFDDTAGLGLGLGGAGAAALGVGVYLLWRSRDAGGPAPIVSVDSEATWVGLRGSF